MYKHPPNFEGSFINVLRTLRIEQNVTLKLPLALIPTLYLLRASFLDAKGVNYVRVILYSSAERKQRALYKQKVKEQDVSKAI